MMEANRTVPSLSCARGLPGGLQDSGGQRGEVLRARGHERRGKSALLTGQDETADVHLR